MSIQIKYEKRIVCFIDILGFAKLIKDSINKNEEKKEIALKKLNVIYNTYTDFAAIENSEITQFSDSIVVSIPYNQEDGAFLFLCTLQHLLMNLADNKILCRGGIVIGELYHKQSIVCGPALIDAYMLESKIANYPRVIVGPNIIKIAKTYKGNQNSEQHIEEAFKRVLGYDSDGYYYIDYLNLAGELDGYEYNDYLYTIHEMIEENLQNSDITIRAKYTWLGLKYNEMIHKLGATGFPLAQTDHLIIYGVNDKYK